MVFRSVGSRLLFWVAGTTGGVFALAMVYSFLVSRTFVLRDASRIAIRTAESGARQVEEVVRSVEEGAIAPGVYEAVKSFAGRAPQSDDITVMAVGYTPDSLMDGEGRDRTAFP